MRVGPCKELVPKCGQEAKGKGVQMIKWEYKITRYHLQNVARREEGDRVDPVICDEKGQCFLHDTSQAAADMIREAFNEQGQRGWELIQFGYHLGELMCVWKRAVE